MQKACNEINENIQECLAQLTYVLWFNINVINVI